MRVLFNMARHYAPSIIFFDECNAVLHKGGGKWIEHLKTLITALIAEGGCGVLIVGATHKKASSVCGLWKSMHTRTHSARLPGWACLAFRKRYCPGSSVVCSFKIREI